MVRYKTPAGRVRQDRIEAFALYTPVFLGQSQPSPTPILHSYHK